jgi:erythromycin esterase-like protein
MTMMPGVEIKGMGYLLHQALQDKMVSIGASFNKGEFQEENRIFEPTDSKSIDGVLASLEMPYFLINLNAKTENPEVEKWLSTENTMRGQEFEMSIAPREAFDAFFFTDSISKVRYNPLSLERFRN